MALSQITFEFGNDSQKKNENKNAVPANLLPQKSKRGRKSLKEMGIDADLIEIPEDEILFKKQYYSIGDVATKNLKIIEHLLRERKYTIDGAKEFLKNNKAAGEKHEMIESLQKIKSFLLELKNNL